MKTVHINNSWFLDSDLRIDASFHLSDGVKTKRIIEKYCPYPTTTLAQESEQLYKGNIHKRVYVDSPENGYMFFTASDLFKSDVESNKFISKKYSSYLKELEIVRDWIFITRSGTLGKVFLTTSDYEGKIGTDDLVRIKPNEDKVKLGVLYAFLSSKYGYGLITQSGYGGVVKHIEPHHVETVKIPVFPENLQGEINDLIISVSNLRVEANQLLMEAVAYFESIIGESKVHLDFQTGTINSSSLNSFHKRIDSQFQLLWKNLNAEKLDSIKYDYLSEFAKSIFVGGRGKRNYVEQGIPFLSSSEMMLFNPKRGCKNVSKNNPGLNSMIVNKKDILISRSGTVGNTVLVGSDLAGTAISEHALRLVIDPAKISPNYVFCFLKTKYGMKSMEASSFGSVIITLNEDLIGNIKIPLLEKESQDRINELIESYLLKVDLATKNENLAINLIEEEIESWQK
jgi:type I restriction enzyme S subunit